MRLTAAHLLTRHTPLFSRYKNKVLLQGHVGVFFSPVVFATATP